MATTPTSLPVYSESPRDLKFNSGKIDEFVTSMGWTYIDRFGSKHYTIEGLRWLAQQAISTFGYVTLDSFQVGADITLPNQILRDVTTGEYYRWDGALPKNVPAGSTPESSGGVGAGAWVSVGDASVRSNINLTSGESFKSDARALNNKTDIIRVSTWNIWTYGSTYNYFGKDISSKDRTLWLKRVFLASGSDIIGMQEVWANAELTAADYTVWPYKSCDLGMVYDQGRGWISGNATLSRFETTSAVTTLFTEAGTSDDPEPRGFTRSVTNINGNLVSIYNTHLSTSNVRIPQEVAQLFNVVVQDSNSRVVITADWNFDDVSLLSMFINNGFTLVNNHEFNTNNVGGEWYIDMILHKGFIEGSKGVFDVPRELSDHKMLYVDLRIQ